MNLTKTNLTPGIHDAYLLTVLRARLVSPSSVYKHGTSKVKNKRIAAPETGSQERTPAYATAAELISSCWTPHARRRAHRHGLQGSAPRVVSCCKSWSFAVMAIVSHSSQSNRAVPAAGTPVQPALPISDTSGHEVMRGIPHAFFRHLSMTLCRVFTSGRVTSTTRLAHVLISGEA